MTEQQNADAATGFACPNCEKPATHAHKPFCSKRCADVDLGQWFKGSYAIPAVEPPDDWSEQSLTQPNRQSDLSDNGDPDDRSGNHDGDGFWKH